LGTPHLVPSLPADDRIASDEQDVSDTGHVNHLAGCANPVEELSDARNCVSLHFL